jgi:CheY-like chemotaxis protein
MEAVGRLAGGVAHDFNNLLTVICGYSELLLKGSKPESGEARMAQIILNTGLRAAAVTSQLLAFSRKQVMVPRVLDLGELIANLASLLCRTLGEDVQLVTAREPGLGPVKADPTQIEQVLVNLAVNARDAMPAGGTLTMETTNVEIDGAFVQLNPGSRSGPHVLITVRDTGIGMNEEVMMRMFEPFFTTKPSGKGTGLGLSMVYGVVKQSGGFISVESKPRNGTTFRMYLPRHGEAKAAPVEIGKMSEAPTGTETVLVVEDEQALRGLVVALLRSAGYTVLEAQSSGEALLIAERTPENIDLLFTDVVLPYMSGPELAERLVAARPGLRTLFTSGYTDDVALRKVVADSSTPFLQKPFSFPVLARKVREVLDTPWVLAVR